MNDPWRPRVHFTPARNWINDPNGLIWHDGEYHLFYQANPHGDQWGHMSWGHAVSLDMLCWRDLPLAIPETTDRMAFSGSAVVDHGRTSGLGSGVRGGKHAPLVAVYTGHANATDPARRIQDQRLAWSADRGRTWTLVKDPVLDIGSTAFRDPKVFFHEATRRWVMLVSHADEGKLAFYTSHDLRAWTHSSDWRIDIPGGKTWECPDLMQVPIEGEPGATAWVIKVDVFDGHPAGGSGAIVVVGDFDGARFTPKQPLQWVDGGRDFYAAIAFATMPPGDRRCVWLGWMSDHRYAKDTPTPPWRGAMTIPRELRLVRRGSELALCQRPIAELDAMRGKPRSIANPGVGAGVSPVELIAPGTLPAAHDIDVEVDAATAKRWRLAVRCGGNEATFVTVDREAGTLGIDRRAAGIDLPSGNFAGHHTIAWPGARAPSARLRIVVDACSVEVFAADGSAAVTSLVFPQPTSTGIRIDAEGEAVIKRMTVWPLAAAMKR